MELFLFIFVKAIYLPWLIHYLFEWLSSRDLDLKVGYVCFSPQTLNQGSCVWTAERSSPCHPTCAPLWSPWMWTRLKCYDRVFRLVVAIGCFLFLVRGGWVISFHDQLRCPSILNWVSHGNHGIWFWDFCPSWNSSGENFGPLSTLNRQSKRIHWKNTLPDMFGWHIQRATLKGLQKNNMDIKKATTSCHTMPTHVNHGWYTACTVEYYVVHLYLYLGHVYCLLWSKKFRVKTSSLTAKKNVFATRVGPEVCYLIQVCRFKPTQIDILILYQRLIWKNNWRTLVLDFFRQHVVSMPGTSSTFLPGLSSHHFSKWHGVLRATFDGTLGKSALRSLGWEAVSVILNEWGAVWLFGQQNVGCFFTWDGRLLDFWDSIADAWWNNMLHKLISIYIYIYRFIDIVINTWFNNPVPTVQTLPGVAILTGIELMICFVHSALFHVLDAGGFYHFRNWPLGGEEFPGWYAWSIGWRRGEDGRGWPEKCLTTSNEGKQESLEIEPFKRCVPKMPEWSCNSC